jgi:hypothetical protein
LVFERLPAGRRRVLRTLTVDRLAAKAADRSASSAAPASTNALTRIGVGKVMGVVPSCQSQPGVGRITTGGFRSYCGSTAKIVGDDQNLMKMRRIRVMAFRAETSRQAMATTLKKAGCRLELS